jgi:hypothetical protein
MARKRDDTVKLVLRLPPKLHRALKRQAARRNQSLNSEMVNRLLESVAREGLIELRDDYFAPHARPGSGPMSDQKVAEVLGKVERLLETFEGFKEPDDGEKK